MGIRTHAWAIISTAGLQAPPTVRLHGFEAHNCASSLSWLSFHAFPLPSIKGVCRPDGAVLLLARQSGWGSGVE